MRMTMKNLYLVLLIAALIISLPSDNFGQGKKPKTNNKKVAKVIPGDKENAEGDALYETGTETSLKAALVKYSTAYQLYERGNQQEKLAVVAINLGITYKKLNNLQKALEHYQNALQIYEQLGDNGGRGATLTNLGAIYRDARQFQDALNYFQQALPLQRLIKSKENEAKTLNGIGECYLGLGNVAQAVNFVQQAYNIWQTLGGNQDRVRTTYNLGRINLFNGETQKGLDLLNRALTDSRQYNNPILEGDILESLAGYYFINGELTKAIEYRRRIFDAYTNAKAFSVTPSRVLFSVNSLIVSYYRAGDFQNAYKYLEDGIAYGTTHNEKIMTAYLYGNKGVLMVDQGNYSEGMRFLEQGIESCRQTKNKMTEAYFLASLGIANYEVGEEQEGVNSLNQALQLIPAGSDPQVEGKILSGLIRIYAGMENKGKTEEMIRLAATRKLDNGINAGTVQVLAAAGYAENIFGNNKESLRLLNLAWSVANKLNHEVEKAKILFDISAVYEAENKYQDALQAVQTSHDFWKKIGNQPMDLETHFRMGTIYSLMEQNQSAIDNFKTVLGFPQEIGLDYYRASSQLFLGLLYFENKDYQSSINSYNQALMMFESLGDKDNQKTALNGIADVYEANKDKKKAKEYRDKVKKIKN